MRQLPFGLSGSYTCPFGQCFKTHGLPTIGESKTAGKKPWGVERIARAVFVITEQGKAAACELDADLVTAPRVKADANKRCFAGGKPRKFQARIFYTLALLFYDECLVFSAVFE